MSCVSSPVYMPLCMCKSENAHNFFTRSPGDIPTPLPVSARGAVKPPGVRPHPLGGDNPSQKEALLCDARGVPDLPPPRGYYLAHMTQTSGLKVVFQPAAASACESAFGSPITHGPDPGVYRYLLVETRSASLYTLHGDQNTSVQGSRCVRPISSPGESVVRAPMAATANHVAADPQSYELSRISRREA
jgi:hypothetical protein